MSLESSDFRKTGADSTIKYELPDPVVGER